MKLFKKHIAGNYMARKSDSIAAGIAGFILKAQERFALFFGARTCSWKPQHQRFFLWIVVVSFGGMSLFAVVSAFTKKPQNNSLKPYAITLPKQPAMEKKRITITDSEYVRVRDFKIKHPGLAKDYPALYDSLLLIEEIYQSQKAK